MRHSWSELRSWNKWRSGLKRWRLFLDLLNLDVYTNSFESSGFHAQLKKFCQSVRVIEVNPDIVSIRLPDAYPFSVHLEYYMNLKAIRKLSSFFIPLIPTVLCIFKMLIIHDYDTHSRKNFQSESFLSLPKAAAAPVFRSALHCTQAS